MSDRYPGSVDGIKATTYGPINVHNRPALAIVLHTTETVGVPGYSGGDVAPHYTYDPAARKFYRHASLSEYVGTMRGHSSGGHTNCKAIQLEILAYSDRTIADADVRRLWIGDLTDAGYDDLGSFVAWVREETGIGDEVTPTPAGGWLYGTSSPHRLSSADWDRFDGLTAHGAVPYQTHWDTGVLALERISGSGSVVPPPDPDPDSFPIDVSRLLVSQSTNDYAPDVSILQGLLISHGYSLERHGVDGVFGPETRGRLEAYQRDHGLTADGIAGVDTWTSIEIAP